METWRKALNNIMPSVEVKSRRVGGATFQVPTEVRPDRKISLGIKWMITYARKRGEKTMTDKLAGEIIAAAKGKVLPLRKKTILTGWPKQTKPSHILDFNNGSRFKIY